jgi:hypothetical protein
LIARRFAGVLTALGVAERATSPILRQVGERLVVPADGPARYTVTRGQGGPTIAVILPATATVNSGRFFTRYTFSDGTAWLAGLDPSLAAGTFVGVAFDTATLTVPTGVIPGPPPGPHPTILPAATPRTIVVPDDATAELTAHPGAGTAPSGSVVDDGAAATITPPATAVFALDPAGASLTDLGDAAATAYGSSCTFSGGLAGTAVDAASGQWVARYAAVTGTFDCSAPVSQVFVTAGSSAGSDGAWQLPTRTSPPDQLPAADAGRLGVRLGPGLSARWGSAADVRPLQAVHLVVGTGQLQLTASYTATRPVVDTYELWDTGTADHSRPAAVTVQAPTQGTVVSAQSALGDIVTTGGCRVVAHVDRPCLVDGTTPALDRLSVQAMTAVSATGTTLALIGAGPPLQQGTESYLLENGLLGTSGVTELLLLATLNGSVATNTTFVLASTATMLVPTLPNPYAATPGAATQLSRTLLAGVSWTAPGAPEAVFELLGGTAVAGRQPGFAGRGLAESLLILYDVSGADDQLGVVLTQQALRGAQIDEQALTVSGQSSALFALPQIAWEAVISEDTPGDRRIFNALAGDDGPSMAMNVITQELRPMTPAAFVERFLDDYEAGADLIARFTLPFGLEAGVTTAASDPPSAASRPTLLRESPDFGAEVGGAQLSLAAPSSPFVRQIMPGRSYTTTDSADPGYPPAILETNIANFWDQEFSTGIAGVGTFVPVDRVALSGYGTSTFSDYVDETIGVGVAEARFDVVVGRTSFALVQIRSLLCPWGVVVVNTTIFQRDGAGWVQRRNTGWRAKTPATFTFDSGPAPELGGVVSVLNVRNIVERPTHVSAGGKDWVEVGFDADVAVVTTGPNALLVTGGDIGQGRVAGTGFTGWIDQTVSVSPPNMTDVLALMDTVHDAAGRLTGEIVAGANGAPADGIRLTLTGIDVEATNAGPRALGVALRGLPHLPRDGSWSVARRSSTQLTPRPVDPLTPVPLVRARSDPSTWHLADPADVLSLANPANLYSFVQATGTQQLLFEHPTITSTAGQNPLNFRQTPALADVGALLGSSGLLPELGAMLKFPSFTGFVPSGDGLATTQTLTQTTVLADTTLVPLGPISVVMATRPGAQSVITVVIDPAATPRWQITITNVAFKLLVDGMSTTTDPLVSVNGDIEAADGQKPTVTNLQFAYGSSLSVVKDVLSGIQALADALPGGYAGLDVSFTGTKLRIRDAVSLPALPLGLGYLEGIALDLGFEVDILAKTMHFDVGVGSDEDPFTWLASPLAGNGLLQLGAGEGGLGVRMQGGIGVGLGIDLAIASGSASVCIAAQLDTTKTPFGVMLLLTGSASVDVLDGLASASLTLTAGLGIQVSPGDPNLLLPPNIPPKLEQFIEDTSVTLSAEVAVAIHLSVAWVVHVDWSGSWGFSETLSGSALTSLLP